MSTAAKLQHGAHAPVCCPNCNAVVSGNFCANCGQEAVLHHASTREFLHEFIGHYVALEGKLWGTLGRLLFRPGALTNEYIRGRRVRFVQPLRIYLTLSVLFFAALKFTSGFNPVLEPKEGEVAVHEASAAKAASATPAPPTAPAAEPAATDDHDLNNNDITKLLKDWPKLQHQWIAFEGLSHEDQKKAFSNGFYHYAPYAMFCLMPVFALYLKILYLGSGRRFGEHMLFALHTNAFAYLIFLLMLFIDVGIVKAVLWCWLLGYLPWAMRRVYHSSRFGVFWRWSLLMAVYSISIGLAIALSAGAGIMTVGH